jgi:mercuric ion binding protein
MKAIIIFLAFLAMAFQHLNSADIKVYGQCEVCKRRIETALKLNGIYSASWNVETKLLTVQYDDKLISTDKIQQVLATAGHDTDKYHAPDKAYNALPACCHYPRAKS